MFKQFKHIEIVRSTTIALSSMSQESCDAIYAVLSKKYERVGVTIVNTYSDLVALVDSAPDLVFLGMEFVPAYPSVDIAGPDKIWVCDYLDTHEIAYTGSDSGAYKLQRNKSLAKQRVLSCGLSTSAYYVVHQGESLNIDSLGLPFPLFVKPLDRGGGLGIDSGSVVHNPDQLAERVKHIDLKLGSDSLIEKYLTGREFSVAVLKDWTTEEYLAMPIELIAPEDENGARLLSGSVKSLSTEQAIEVFDQELHAQLCKFSLDIFSALGAQDFGRVDIRLDSEGKPQFLEANLIPSLIDGYGSFPKACAINYGIRHGDMISKIVEVALARKYTNLEVLNEDKAIIPNLYLTADIIPESV